jgi:hypothetical protein
MNQIVKENPSLGDESAENSLEVIAEFNKDMQTLALNAYQMQELLDAALEENNLILEWMRELEDGALNAEQDITKMSRNITKAAKSLLKAHLK